MALEHEDLRLKHSLVAQREVNSHLVTVEVGVKCSTCQRMQLDCLAFDKFWLESLYTETVQCRRTVEKHRVTLHYVLKNIPYYGLTTIDNLLRALDGLNYTALDELTDDKRLVKLGCHQLRKTTLTHLQFRTDDDYRTCRIVNTLTEKVLAETSLLTFQ